MLILGSVKVFLCQRGAMHFGSGVGVSPACEVPSTLTLVRLSDSSYVCKCGDGKTAGRLCQLPPN